MDGLFDSGDGDNHNVKKFEAKVKPHKKVVKSNQFQSYKSLWKVWGAKREKLKANNSPSANHFC